MSERKIALMDIHPYVVENVQILISLSPFNKVQHDVVVILAIFPSPTNCQIEI